MSDIAIKFENVSKQYRLGTIGTGTLSHDLGRWWARVRGKEDPFLKVGQENVLNTHREPGTGSHAPEIVWALKDINLEVRQGEVLGIIGKNGAGKSTLLKLLSRVTTPTTGSIKVRGRIASLLEVGTGFHLEMTGRENIFMNGSIMGMTKAEIRRKFDEIVDFAGVETYIDTPVKRYSSGMLVRLGFAVAAHLEPEILVVDEVLAVGDADFQKKAIGKIQDVSRKNGRTVLFVSHNMLAIRSLCHNALFIKEGQIVDRGVVNIIVDRYLAYSSLKTGLLSTSVWENNYIKILSFEIVNTENGNFYINNELKIKVGLLNKSVNENINVNLFFKSIDGTIIFATISDLTKIPLGYFMAVCNVPPFFFNDNLYTIDLMVVRNGESQLIFIPDIIQIEGIEPPRSISWLEKFPGIIRPKFPWEINF